MLPSRRPARPLGACTRDDASSSPAADLNVTVTIKPIHALVAQVMEGVGTPALLVTGASSPHTYALKPSDAKALYASDVVFRVSEAVEPFTARIVKALPENVRVGHAARMHPASSTRDVRAGDTFEAHAHGQDAHDDDHGVEAEHREATGRASSRQHAAHDGHVWLDPANARHMVAEIARVLSEVSPRNAPALQGERGPRLRPGSRRSKKASPRSWRR